jgi:anti-anti-sigma factor
MTSEFAHPLRLLCEPTRVTIILEDSMDQTAMPLLQDLAMTAVGQRLPIDIDCQNVSFLPTGAIQILLGIRRDCQDRNIAFTLCGISEAVAVYLRQSGLALLLYRDATVPHGVPEK